MNVYKISAVIIISLFLINFTGCGEKEVVSGMKIGNFDLTVKKNENGKFEIEVKNMNTGYFAYAVVTPSKSIYNVRPNDLIFTTTDKTTIKARGEDSIVLYEYKTDNEGMTKLSQTLYIPLVNSYFE